MILGYFISFHQMTPLHRAAESGRIEVVEILIDQVADINSRDDNGVIIYDNTYQYF